MREHPNPHRHMCGIGCSCTQPLSGLPWLDIDKSSCFCNLQTIAVVTREGELKFISGTEDSDADTATKKVV